MIFFIITRRESEQFFIFLDCVRLRRTAIGLPLPVIDEVVKRIKDETIVDYEYDLASEPVSKGRMLLRKE